MKCKCGKINFSAERTMKYMSILDIVIAVFMFFETLNVIIIYVKPDFKYGNGMSAFKQWQDCKQDEKLELFSKYMANWVAGTKIIFILLLGVILFSATDMVKLYAVTVMVPATAIYYIKLHPIIKKLDTMGQISPEGYSKTLRFMITGFIIMFITAAAIASAF